MYIKTKIKSTTSKDCDKDCDKDCGKDCGKDCDKDCAKLFVNVNMKVKVTLLSDLYLLQWLLCASGRKYIHRYKVVGNRQ